MVILILLTTLIMAMLLLCQLYPLVVSYRSLGKKAPQLKGIIPENLLVGAHKRYTLYFGAPHYGMCPNMTHVIDKLSKGRNDLATINAAEHAELAYQMGVMETPALVLIENGRILKIALGTKTEKRILSFIEPSEDCGSLSDLGNCR